MRTLAAYPECLLIFHISDLTNGVFHVAKKSKVIDLDAESETRDKVYIWMMEKIDKHEKTIDSLRKELEEAKEEVMKLKSEKMQKAEIISVKDDEEDSQNENESK